MASAKTLTRKSRHQKSKAKSALSALAPTTPITDQVVEKKPKGFLDLPYDIRYMIYKLWFIRPVGIVPKDSFYRRSLRRNDKYREGDGSTTRKYTIYQCQWESNIQQLPQWGVDGLPTRDGTLDEVTIFRIFSATPEQLELIADSPWLPSTGTSTDEHSNIHNYLINSAGDPVEIATTCKQIRDEETEILYGSNEFIFDTCHSGAGEKFQDDPDQVPGARLLDGTLPSQEQIETAIEKLFDRKVRHPKCVWYDRFLRFLAVIGRHNAARLKSVVFSGAFEVASSYSSGWMGFAQLLSVYTVVMSNVCPNLNRITLHKQLGGLIWKIEQPEDEGKTKDERVSEVVEKLVNGLPSSRSCIWAVLMLAENIEVVSGITPLAFPEIRVGEHR
ncbi:hypothetical protein BKA61DRAFT_740540 [Leptodontidium sp. MPI-SDFR-AT-0119]|nr:hypothetical protein BKA61DRAFT_740540 [Leptodontidium sp. MPI-SDFR-AT-0119]